MVGVLKAGMTGNFLVHQIALQDGVGTDVEHGNEDGSDHVGEQEDHEEGEEGGLNFGHS